MVVVAAWGTAFSGIKVLLRDLTPGGLTSIRLTVAALTYVALLPFVRGRVDRRPGDLPRLLIAGVLTSAAYHLALNWGERFVSAGLASLIVSSMPALVAVAAAIVLGEQLGPRRGMGVAVAFAGVGVLVVGSGGVVQGSALGAAVTLLAPTAWAASTILSKPLSARYDGVRLNLVGGTVGALVVAPFGIADAEAILSLDMTGWLWVLWLGAVCQALATVVWVWALRRWPASRVASVVYLVPALSLLWAWILLDEVPSGLSVGGGLLVVAGVALVQRAGMSPRADVLATP